MKKRLLSALLTFCMVLTLLPVSAFAVTQPTNNSDHYATVSKTAERTGADTWDITMEETANTQIEPEPLELVLVMDYSYSMQENVSGATGKDRSRMYVAGNAAKNLIRDLQAANVNAKVSVVKFAEDAQTPQKLIKLTEANVDSICNKIPAYKSAAYGMGTNMRSGLVEAGEQLKANSNAKQVIIMLSDGQKRGGGDPISYASTLKNTRGIEIYTVGFAADVDTLAKIATDSAHYYTTSTVDGLTDVFTAISASITAMVDDSMGEDRRCGHQRRGG